MSAVERVLGDLMGLAIETQPQKVKRRSRDFYWYSPILKRRLDQVTAEAVVPKGVPSTSVVTTVTPEAKWPTTWRKVSRSRRDSTASSVCGVLISAPSLHVFGWDGQLVWPSADVSSR